MPSNLLNEIDAYGVLREDPNNPGNWVKRGLPVSLGGATYTWATKPAANAVPVGYAITVTDVGTFGRIQMWSDGTNWRCVNGKATLLQLVGSVATPIATISGSANANFALPGGNPVFPAGFFIPGVSVIGMDGMLRRHGANGTVVFRAYMGTTGTTADSILVSTQLAATDLVDLPLDVRVGVSSAAGITRSGTPPRNSPTANVFVDSALNFNTAAAMTLFFAVSSGNVLDSYDLEQITVWVRQ